VHGQKAIGGFVSRFVLPHNDGEPASLAQPVEGVFVSVLDRLELRGPPGAVARRHHEVLWAAVPEAAVNQHCYACAAKQDIHAPPFREADWRDVDEEAHAPRMKGLPQCDLWAGVTAAVGP
jgi:hypothetical protein